MNQHLNNPIKQWLMNHLRAILYSTGEMVRRPIASTMTLIVIGIAMALPAGLYVLLQNFQTLSQEWGGKPGITLYLKQNTSNKQISQLMSQLNRNVQIAKVRYISPQQGLNQFERLSQFNNILAGLKKNPLPGVLIITPVQSQQTPTAMQILTQELKNQPFVASAQLDVAWIKRLYYIIMLGKRFIYMLALLFGLGVILIIGNTLRLTTQNQLQEINILKLVGATPAFIQRPFLYRGLWYGILGGAISWFLVGLLLWWLEAPTQALAKTYNNTLLLHGFQWTDGIAIISVSALLGLAGSWLAIHRHLRTPESS